jgi:hypothetical protein
MKKNPGDYTILPGVNTAGEEILSVVVKRSYTFSDGRICSRRKEDSKLLSGDVYFDDENSSVKYENDYVPCKNKTDVVINAKAYSPTGRPKFNFFTSVRIDNITKRLLIYGDRQAKKHSFKAVKFSDPEPFVEMEIRYENAYGGTDYLADPEIPYSYPRNPIGKGFIVNAKNLESDGFPLPNIEDPKDVLTPQNLCIKKFENWQYQPVPQSFGWYNKLWHPRVSYAGLLPNFREYEKEMRQRYSGYVSENQKKEYAQTETPQMNFSFFNGASPGLQLPFLRGNEEITLENLSKENNILTFALPDETPFIRFDFGFGVNDIDPRLHTVMIEAEKKTVDLVWCGSVTYPGMQWLPEMKVNNLVIE